MAVGTGSHGVHAVVGVCRLLGADALLIVQL